MVKTGIWGCITSKWCSILFSPQQVHRKSVRRTGFQLVSIIHKFLGVVLQSPVCLCIHESYTYTMVHIPLILIFVFIPLASGGSGPMPPTPKPLFSVWFFLPWSHHSCKHTVSKFYYSWNLLLPFKHLASGAVVQTPACTPLHIYFIRFWTLLLLGATDSFLRFHHNSLTDIFLSR